ncbi:MAG: bifunctional riboflavin kinase/FAD synthetase [Chloroflexota bacterium]|nr:bifunctional riboflavin kinase/FAD synthetase [Chloroflexota bacterium]
MGLFQELKIEKELQDSFITVGVFDGVHLGHKHLMEKLTESARKNRKSSGILTFKNHPATILNPKFQPNFLTSLETKLALLEATGVDFVSAITFDKAVAEFSAKDFLCLLKRELGMKGLVVGPDFQMGKNREAGVERLSDLGKEIGFTLEIIELQEQSGMEIRSTVIRNMISTGNMREASIMLGRLYSLRGLVITGMKRGRLLGFPTANITFDQEICIPANGIYATIAIVNGIRYPAATSIGTNPTFNGKEQTVETYILDFDKDIYGEEITIEFYDRLRDELLFENVDDLLVQMKADISTVKKLTKSGELR